MDDVNRARGLIDRYGWNTTCFQILNPGISRWFAPDGTGVVGFVRRAGVRVVAGAPVCSKAELPRCLELWEGSDESPVCYFGAEERLQQCRAGQAGVTTVVMGAQPIWSPESWMRAVHGSKSLRYQLNRAKNKGVVVEEWPPDRVRDHPGLRVCLDYWLRTRGLPPLHFLVEPEILSQPEGRRVFVMQRRERPIGFVVLAPIPSRNGWLTEMFVRGPGAPNGAIELGLTHAVERAGLDGATFVTMGMVPLSNRAGNAMEDNPSWLRFLSAWSRAHMRRFYDFEGLDTFKSKFCPDEYQPIRVIVNEPRFRARTLYAIASAFTESNPVIALSLGLAKAVGTEARWLADRLVGRVRLSPGTNLAER